MRSTKKVKPLKELILPFTITPTRDIYGGVNGKQFYFPKGKESVMDYSQFEAVLLSDYRGTL
jgi:Mor family transcriptional regulator